MIIIIKCVGEILQFMLTQGDTRVARQFFSALASEPPGARAGVQEAVAMLATAYAGGNGTAEQSHELEMLLLDSSSSPQVSWHICQLDAALIEKRKN